MFDLKDLMSRVNLPQDITRRGFLQVATVTAAFAAMNQARAQTGAQPFFSRELCAKYFTYMNADGQAHFVLYDDDSTLAAKLAQLAGCGVQNVFALFPDAAGLLKPQT